MKKIGLSAFISLLLIGLSTSPVRAGVGFHLGTWVSGKEGSAGYCSDTDAVSCGALEIGKFSAHYNWGAWTE